MSREKKIDLELDLGPAAINPADLMIPASRETPLTPAQAAFNRQMKQLENARSKLAREQARLDRILDTSIRELMPLVEELNQTNRDLVFAARQAMDSIKLSKRRRHWFADLVACKAANLLDDPVGLGEPDLDRLQKIITDLFPEPDEEELREEEKEEFEELREIMEQVARNMGVDLDLSGLDLNGDPAEFERQLHERLGSAAEAFKEAKPTRRRKPTKANLEKQRREQELEQAKARDFKSLYKQLAKALHPDLETDPVLKEHREAWMKRLTAAHANGDLRDMLEIELEWLGEEAGNLAKAGDEKLKIYGMVLKEQTAEIKLRTELLFEEPQYGPLHRFMNSFTGHIPEPARIKPQFLHEISRHREMLQTLTGGGAAARIMINDWADENARAAEQPPYPF